jgi:3'(2'), 5'-bisphosphate nucleotidase
MALDLAFLLDAAGRAALEAGAAILEIYATEFDIRHKEDRSPVTHADEEAERRIVRLLADAAPGIPIIAEELAAAHGLPATAPPLFWLVDPLDGTKEFVARNGEFCVNVALVEGERPLLGVVHAPVSGVTFAARGPGTATRRVRGTAPEPISCRPPPSGGCTVTHSRSHSNSAKLDAWLAGKNVAARRVSGSAIKFGLIAAGEADLYPRFGPTMEWDTAAGQAILEAAGGSVVTLDGAPLRYGKPGFINDGFIARGWREDGM